MAGSPASAGMVLPSRFSSPRLHGFPRVRGDGPKSVQASEIAQRVPPRPRGWSLDKMKARLVGVGSPASAGMVPVANGVYGDYARFPRVRGDGPSKTLPRLSRRRVPPRPRGWSHQNETATLQTSGSPASAGMVPHCASARSSAGRFPRVRGDGPGTGAVLPGTFGVPPRPRGWSLALIGLASADKGSPASAGMVPRSRIRRMNRVRFPRVRGDGPDDALLDDTSYRVPPRPRGWSQVRVS